MSKKHFRKPDRIKERREKKRDESHSIPRRELERGKAPAHWEVPLLVRKSAGTEEELKNTGGVHSDQGEAVEKETILHSQCYGNQKPYSGASRGQELKFWP